MVIIKVKGGLGNQLFQYALYKNYVLRGIEAKVDLSFFEEKCCDRKYELENLGIHAEKATRREIRALYGDNASFFNKVGRKTIGRSKYFREEDLDYYPEVHKFTDKYLNGYWQDARYFSEAAETIRKEIHFAVEEWMIDDQLRDIINNCNTTSIHVRLGDYVGHAELGGICTESYYEAAIRYIDKYVGKTEYIIISDDVDAAGQMFRGEHFHCIRHKEGTPDHVDMYLMTQCNQNIIANSTFSWWGAWLNPNRRKIVVAPEKWMESTKKNNIVCRDWVRIDNYAG